MLLSVARMLFAPRNNTERRWKAFRKSLGCNIISTPLLIAHPLTTRQAVGTIVRVRELLTRDGETAAKLMDISFQKAS